MPGDLARLETMGTFTDPGRYLRALRGRDARERLHAGVFSLPPGAPGTTGWVITDSFGPEQPNLNAVDVAIARPLAVLDRPCFGSTPGLRRQRARDLHAFDPVTRPGHGRCDTGAPRPDRRAFDRLDRSGVRRVERRARGIKGVRRSPCPDPRRRFAAVGSCGSSCEPAPSSSSRGPTRRHARSLVRVAGGRVDQHPRIHHLRRPLRSSRTGSSGPRAGSPARRCSCSIDRNPTTTRRRRTCGTAQGDGARVTTTIVSDPSAALFGEHTSAMRRDLLADVGAELHRKKIDRGRRLVHRRWRFRARSENRIEDMTDYQEYPVFVSVGDHQVAAIVTIPRGEPARRRAVHDRRWRRAPQPAIPPVDEGGAWAGATGHRVRADGVPGGSETAQE